MIYHVQFTPQALEDLSRLDAAIARRIAEKIQWLAEHFDQIQPETLTGPFASLFKLPETARSLLPFSFESEWDL